MLPLPDSFLAILRVNSLCPAMPTTTEMRIRP